MSTQQMYVNQVPVAEIRTQPTVQNSMGYSVPGTYYGDATTATTTVQIPPHQMTPQQMPLQQMPLQQMQQIPVDQRQVQMSEVQYEAAPQHKGKWKTGMLIAAFVIAVLTAVALIIFAFIYGFGSHTNNKRPGWTIVNITSKTPILYAAGNNIFTIASSVGSVASVSPPINGVTNPYRSRMFIINNTANRNDLVITAAPNCTMIDNTPNPGVIPTQTSATYYWTADSDTFVRLD